MEKKDRSLFSENRQGNNTNSHQLKKEEKTTVSKGIVLNKKLTLYLKKYVDSFDELSDKIELKGKLIDLIRKL